ncbi:MAG: sigma-54-dependent Fis family transcriptional regulator, partial [Proteobacteria bacterium]|nr:sigma-54-dependent Fis family transcriptional regulator [Pseudomonadota bacterium]
PLRDRKEDIPLLTDKFIKNINLKLGTRVEGLTKSAAKALFNYDWPGNVRQLANALERASIFCKGNRLSEEEIDLALQRAPRQAESGPAPAQAEPDFSKPLKILMIEHERQLIKTALRRTGGVQTEAATLLGISPKNLWNKLQKHAIDPSESTS